ncbi:MAG: hypothetical protein ACJ8H8_32590 [Geminicoccaceae bacterium]
MFYHAPDGFDDRSMMAVVGSRRLAAEGLTTMLHRKLDWTDLDGLRWLLTHGADPNLVAGSACRRAVQPVHRAASAVFGAPVRVWLTRSRAPV